MSNGNDLIRNVLTDHSEYKLFEEVQAECARRGTEVGIWTIYFVAKTEGRKLHRRPVPANPDEVIRDVALTLLGLHRSADDTFATLKDVADRNRKDNRIPWEVEKTASTETWELSVAQELIDLCGGSLDTAIKAVSRR